ncbi:MAG: HD domain-containing protein [Candidatus Promineifilaceae bacterium]
MTELSSYLGQWVATRGSELLAAGASAVRVYRAALAIDPSENFFLHFIEDETSESLPLAPLVETTRPFLEREGLPAYLVGGAVRDAFLERESHDLDFVVPRDALRLTFRLGDIAGAPAYILDKERETGRIVLTDDGVTVDVATYRDADLLADLYDRDFTINAMALPATARTRDSLIDPLGGLSDLLARRIRLTHAEALLDDPVRALRAIRLAAELAFELTRDTEEAVLAASVFLPATVSAERVRDELVKIVDGPRTAAAVMQMHTLGLLAPVLPELEALAPVPQSPPHYEPVLAHTISVLRWLEYLLAGLFETPVPPDDLLDQMRAALFPYLAPLAEYLNRPVVGGLDGKTILGLAALFHDAGKRQTITQEEDGRYRFFGHAEAGALLAAARLRDLCFSNEAIDQVSRIVAEHMRPLLLADAQGGELSRRAAYRYFKAGGASGLDVALLALADHLATYNGPGNEQVWSNLLALVTSLLEFYFNQYEETVKPPALVNGRDLMDYLDLPPGPEIGRLLQLIEENQAAGQIKSVEEALRFARQAHEVGA